MNKVAYITGITGQDGSYLAEHLLSQGYQVYGMVRRMSLMNTERIDHLQGKIKLLYGDVTDAQSIASALNTIVADQPTPLDTTLEVYHLAAQSHVRISFDMPDYTTNVDAIGTLKLLQECHRLQQSDKVHAIKVYIAATSELYGNAYQFPQSEITPFNPCSPYSISKLYAFHIAKMYREGYNMFVAIGILFNHESPRRTANFVTRKITTSLGKILRGEQETIEMGNLDAVRDWGHAKDYVRAMHLMLQHPTPETFVIATREAHTVREFIEEAFKLRNLTITWKGPRGTLQETGVDQHGITRITINPKYYRPIDVRALKGDPSKANRLLGWCPGTSFQELVREMVDHDAANP